MKTIVHKAIGLAILLTLALASCTGNQDQRREEGGLQVLASTSFLADIAQNVAGERTKVDFLLPIGADPHAYQATPQDVVKISKSTMLILNGLEYEHFIEPLLENADGERSVIVASEGLEAQNGGNPHLWLDPVLVIPYVENIRDGLINVDPEGAEIYEAHADAYVAKLRELDAFIREQVETIPAGRRLLVTNHEAMEYFAERYGFVLVDSLLPSFSSDASASAREITEAIDAIKSTGAPAIFLGSVENAGMARQIALETGVQVVDGLHLESLTDGEPAGTYIDMMKYNVSLIVEALR
jgi:ABC-type Zn uptake system ZnuABC Zn-binding protein ZnuA